MSTFTPGPWRIGNLVSYDGYTGRPFRNVWAGDPEHPDDEDKALCVARCVDHGPVDENARLIAAAPAMYDALRLARDEFRWLAENGPGGRAGIAGLSARRAETFDALLCRIDGEEGGAA